MPDYPRGGCSLSLQSGKGHKAVGVLVWFFFAKTIFGFDNSCRNQKLSSKPSGLCVKSISGTVGLEPSPHLRHRRPRC